MKAIYLLLLTLTVSSCFFKHREVREELKLAGENRSELEKVLDYYREDPADSLKYKAAVYLIKRMKDPEMRYPYHPRLRKFEAYISSRRDSFRRYYHLPRTFLIRQHGMRYKFDEIWKEAAAIYGHPNSYPFKTRWDIKTISAELLRENIDYAFKAWNLPWSRQYSFDTFCRYILPYRYGNEALGSWRPLYWDQLHFVLDSMKNKQDPIQAYKLIKHYLNDSVKWGAKSINQCRIEEWNPATILRWGMIKTGCPNQVGLGCAAMRAMGIATTIVHIPVWGIRSRGHELNAVLSPTDNEWIDFHSIGDKNININPKSFLDQYLPRGQKRNHLRAYENMKDVTHWYNQTVDIPVQIKGHTDKSYAYLCTFNNQQWIPAMWGKINQSRALFKNMGYGIMYLPMVRDQGSFVPAGKPIQVDTCGNITRIEPNTGKTISFEFTRKYPLDSSASKARCTDMVGGRFQIADDSLFTHPITLHTIAECQSYIPQKISVKPVKGRYVRYHFPLLERYMFNGPGWIAFYNQTDQGYSRCSGNYITPHAITQSSLDKIFDESLLTFVRLFPNKKRLALDVKMDDFIPYRTARDSFWVGMDLGQTVNIGMIGYCPRNDKNQIYPGMHYELKYWDDQWISLGIIEADSHNVTFDNIPEGALLLLECLDEGKEKRIFTINEMGSQIWW
jgi:hypothetical protein